jgi:hypothetical protein
MLQDKSGAQTEVSRRPEDSASEDWLTALDRHGVRYMVLDRQRDGDLLDCFGSQPGWSVYFQDEEAVIFARAGAA